MARNIIKFESKSVKIDDILGTKRKYIIPEYQRPYVWDSLGKSEKDNQINVMWEDFLEAYNNKSLSFFGSMVFVKDTENKEENIDVYKVIDGQQRLISLTLLFSAIRCIIKDLNINDNEWKFESIVDMKRFIYSKPSSKVELKLESTIFKNIQDYYYKILDCREEEIDKLIKNNDKLSDELKEMVKRLIRNKKFFTNNLKKFFSQIKDHNEFAKTLKNFFDFITRIDLISIELTDESVAFVVFEILNKRGLPLTNKDLFRNFFLSEYSRINSDAGIINWKKLEEDYRFDQEFIGRFVESIKGKKQQYSAFGDIKTSIYPNMKPPINKESIEFLYEILDEKLDIYTKIKELRFDNLEINDNLAFILVSGNTRYALDFLLSVFYNLKSDRDLIKKFVNLYEKVSLFNLLSSKKFLSKNVFEAIRIINNKRIFTYMKNKDADLVFNENKALSYLLLMVTTTQREDLPENGLNQKEIEEIKFSFNKFIKESLNNNITNNNVAKILIYKYYMCKLKEFTKKEQLIDIDLKDLKLKFEGHDADVTLEHIIPKKPETRSNWLTDFSAEFRKEYTYKLGNMTLLKGKVNAKIKNSDFSKKRKKYEKLLLQNFFDKELYENEKITEENIKQRHERIVKTLYNCFKF